MCVTVWLWINIVHGRENLRSCSRTHVHRCISMTVCYCGLDVSTKELEQSLFLFRLWNIDTFSYTYTLHQELYCMYTYRILIRTNYSDNGAFHRECHFEEKTDTQPLHHKNQTSTTYLSSWLHIIVKQQHTRTYTRRIWKKISKLRVNGLWGGPVDSPQKRPVTRKYFHLMTSSRNHLLSIQYPSETIRHCRVYVNNIYQCT